MSSNLLSSKHPSIYLVWHFRLKYGYELQVSSISELDHDGIGPVPNFSLHPKQVENLFTTNGYVIKINEINHKYFISLAMDFPLSGLHCYGSDCTELICWKIKSLNWWTTKERQNAICGLRCLKMTGILDLQRSIGDLQRSTWWSSILIEAPSA